MVKTVGGFVSLVSKMRDAQRAYFRTRAPSALNEAKVFESQVDDEINQFNKRRKEKNQPGLGLLEQK